MASRKTLFVDDSPVSEEVVRQLRDKSLDADIQGCMDQEPALTTGSFVVIDPTMPPLRMDLPTSAAHNDAVETLQIALEHRMKPVVFSYFLEEEALRPLFREAGADERSEIAVFDKQRPEELINYLVKNSDTE